MRRLAAVGLLAVVAVITTARVSQGPKSSPSSASFSPSPSSSAASPSHTLRRNHPGALREATGGLGEADGVVPDGVTVFDDEVPAVAKLDPDLLKALRQAATDAASDGVEFSVKSGWRSPEYQNQLLREAVSTYGSEEEAAHWVATPATSAHVSGDAVDIGHSDATGRLSTHGAEYGLCQIYRNEAWHYELRPNAIDRGCPRMYADPTQDPRMQQ
jgi:D-alanyl-D-alanine carboxypeptidase